MPKVRSDGANQAELNDHRVNRAMEFEARATVEEFAEAVRGEMAYELGG